MTLGPSFFLFPPPFSAAGILWSRLCSADFVGSIPPNVHFVLLRRTRIHRVPPSNVAEGGHARRDQRTPAAFSLLLRTGR